MTTRTRWITAIGFILALMAIGCAGGLDLSKLPPIVIPPAPPTTMPEPPPAPKPRATLGFQVVDACTGKAIVDAIVNIPDVAIKQVNEDGYVALELDHGRYDVRFEASGYAPSMRSYVLSENRPFSIALDPVKGCAPTPSPTPAPTPPVVDQPKPAPPVVLSPLEEAAGWSDEQWRIYVMALLARSGGALVNDASMKVARPDLNARGVDFQNGWRGDLRPRIYLPVAGCPPATRADVPPCSYNRTVDLGQYGQPWEWIKR